MGSCSSCNAYELRKPKGVSEWTLDSCTTVASVQDKGDLAYQRYSGCRARSLAVALQLHRSRQI